MAETTSKAVSIPNISCDHCVAIIEKELGAIPGVLRVSASRADKQVTVTWDNRTSWDALKALLEEIGYPASE